MTSPSCLFSWQWPHGLKAKIFTKVLFNLLFQAILFQKQQQSEKNVGLRVWRLVLSSPCIEGKILIFLCLHFLVYETWFHPKNMNYFFCAKHALVFKVLGAGHKRISTAESNGEDKKVNWWSEDFRGLSRRPASIIVSFLCFLYLLMRRSNQKELNYLPFLQRNNAGFHNTTVSSVIIRLIQRSEI